MATGFESRGATRQTQTQTTKAVAARRKSSSASNGSTTSAYPTSLHAHRQSHNSSKLPAFRFVDLNGVKASLSLPLPSLLQHIPPSPVSPNPGAPANPRGPGPGQVPLQDSAPTLDAAKNAPLVSAKTPRLTTSQAHPSLKPSQNTATITPPESTGQQTPARRSFLISRSRASTFQQSTPNTNASNSPAAATRRPASFPASPTKKRDSSDEHVNIPTGTATPATSTTTSGTAATGFAKPYTRRAPASFSANGAETSSGPPPSLNTQRMQAVETAAQAADPPSTSSTTTSTKEWAQGQRELLLPKALQQSPTDDKRSSNTSRPPPVSFKPHLINGGSTPVKVPPIRGFRSSGSRRSLILDMNVRTMRQYDMGGDDVADSNHLDRTLRALEGRPDDDMGQITPPDSAAHERSDGDDSGDVFLKIAREESRRGNDESLGLEEAGTTNRIVRSSHRRPFSAAIPSYQPTSPPRLSRRLSDQQDTVRQRKMEDDQSTEQLRGFAYRSLGRDKAVSIHPGEDLTRRFRAGPSTPRTLTFQDSDNATYSRRRPSITDSTSGAPSRVSSYRQSNLSYGHTRAAYGSSPLVPRTDNTARVEQHGLEGHGLEGTESTASTTGPSTVWDELDELKSRINRLELTGKIPPTSGAAMSRVSDERPVTANTTLTNNSTSPRRIPGGAGQDVSSTTSSQKETHPILHSALAKSKLCLSNDVYKALESAANDALALSSLLGSNGQGPISSGASTIGGGGVTDRQLRRKADSVCRSLTELCLALSEDPSRQKPAPGPATPQKESPATPTAPKSFATLSTQRKPSVVPDQGLARANTVAITTSPRAMSKLEERRNNLLNGSAMPSPRVVSAAPATPISEMGQGRRSSLLIARRRAGTEEPEEGRNSSLLLRTRRAGTEEPEDGRKTSRLRPRRVTISDEDETQFRVPSRAVTEVAHARSGSRDYTTNAANGDPNFTSSALPRRRLAAPSAVASRLAAPSTPSAIPARRFGDRDGNSVADKLAEDRGQRPLSLGQTAMLNRTGSINRRNRESMIGMPSPAAAGTYR